MEQVPFYVTCPVKASMHYIAEKRRGIVQALESVYANGEVPLGNYGLSLQRSFGNTIMWDNWSFGCPQIQGKVNGEAKVFFDDRIVDVNHLEDHPLLDPAFLSDHWSEINQGTLPISDQYLSALVDLSAIEGSGVRCLSHKDVGKLGEDLSLSEARKRNYIKAFLGLSEREREAYLEFQNRKHGDVIRVYFNLIDGEQKEPRGRLSQFTEVGRLNGSYYLSDGHARFFGIDQSLGRVSSR